MKDKTEERGKQPATDWNIRGGAARNPQMDHPGEGALCPGLDHPGRARKNAQGPLDSNIHRAGEPRRDTHPDWNIRSGASQQAAGPPGLEHPGGCGSKPQTATSGVAGEWPRTGASGAVQEHPGFN